MEQKLTRTCPNCGEQHKPSNMAEFYHGLDDALIWTCNCEEQQPTVQEVTYEN